MSEVYVHATGQTIEADGALLDYYRGEAATVGGYTIDGVEAPRRIASSDFDPGEHTVEEVQAHLAISTPAEVDRVVAAERAGKARVTLVGDGEQPVTEEVEQPAPGEPLDTEAEQPVPLAEYPLQE